MCLKRTIKGQFTVPNPDEVVQLIHRAVMTRLGSIYRMTSLSIEDVVHECLALLLAEKRHEPWFWNALEPRHFGTSEYRFAQRTLFRAVDRAVWRCRDVRKVTVRGGEYTAEHSGRRQRVLERDLALGDSDVLVIDGIASDADRLDRELDVAAAFDGLRGQDKEVLFARAVFKHTWSEIAQNLNIPANEVRTIYHDAMEVLAMSLKAYGSIH